jgi:hypothetical protein
VDPVVDSDDLGAVEVVALDNAISYLIGDGEHKIVERRYETVRKVVLGPSQDSHVSPAGYDRTNSAQLGDNCPEDIRGLEEGVHQVDLELPDKGAQLAGSAQRIQRIGPRHWQNANVTRNRLDQLIRIAAEGDDQNPKSVCRKVAGNVQENAFPPTEFG